MKKQYKQHKHWVSLKQVAISEIFWIRKHDLMAKFMGDNPEGTSGIVATITGIDSNFVYIKCTDSLWKYISENV